MPKISRNKHLSPHYIIPPINHHVKHNSQLIHKYLAARAARSLFPSSLAPPGLASPCRASPSVRGLARVLACRSVAWIPFCVSHIVLCSVLPHRALLGLLLRPLRHVPVSCRLDSPARRQLWASRSCSNLILVRDLTPSCFCNMMLPCR